MLSMLSGAGCAQMLCDKDPGVMGASLHILYDMMKNEPEAFKDLVPRCRCLLSGAAAWCRCCPSAAF